ncbi:hypothetical protein [Croceicoccus sp. Ery15]|uniref:hypothetical protein n=1 Tax=Croceicoccus sp. Ery15 TaxID=1703338 RepID=UPI001E33F879|nr:hypothetical protein [Croceicoccus sp. Ery15]
MKDLLIGGGACAVVGLGVFFSPPFTFGTTEVIDIRNGPVLVASNEEIAGHLMDAALVDGNPPFYRHKTTRERVGTDAVAFKTEAGIDCVARIHRLDDQRAQVVPQCTTPAAGKSAQGAAVQDIMTLTFREFVWARLENRPYDEKKVRTQMGGAAMKHLPAMRQEAIEANIEMHEMQAEMAAARDAREAEKGW